MIKDMSTFAWRVGLAFIVLLPLLYIGQAALVLGDPDQSSPWVRGYFTATNVIPTILVSVGIGVIICLLVRIEAALRGKL